MASPRPAVHPPSLNSEGRGMIAACRLFARTCAVSWRKKKARTKISPLVRARIGHTFAGRGQLMDRGPDTIALNGRPPALVGPCHAFFRMVNALAERDFAEATRARKELRRLGYSVIPLGTPPKAVRR